MSIWVYDKSPDPVAVTMRANGKPALELQIEDGADYGFNGELGTDDWVGESILFTGGKEQALRWLDAARRTVEEFDQAASR